MERIPVKSGGIVSIGYEEAAKTLEIEFNGARIYQYFQVPKSEYEALMAAPSIGTYFAANIALKYQSTKVGSSR